MQSEKSGVSSNVISLPEGGGAMKGMGETFSADLFSGTGNYSVPISVPKGRLGMEPQLSLGYSTGNGNGICGQGWNLSLPGISRKTSLGIPQYRNDDDTFVLSGAEDLIPVAESVEQDGEVRVKRLGYKPRTEGLFARITHITATDGRDYWEVNTKDGKTSVYGNPDRLSENPCRLVDPEDASHIFHWFIFKTYDLLGNEVVYEYNYDVKSDDKYPYSQVYLSRIKYADYPDGGSKNYLCSVKFNYEARPDNFSLYNSGFEIRTKKRISNIETFTHPFDDDLPLGYTPQTGGNNILVKRYNLTYRDETNLGPIGNGVSLLVNVQIEGHGPDSEVETMPPVEFCYTEFDGSLRDLITLNQDHLPSLSLADPSMNMVDLDGNGLPDFVQIQPGLPIRYWKNRGRGEFDLPRQMKDAPVGLSLTDGSTLFMDADGDGRTDLVLNSPRVKGYFPSRYDGQWDEKRYTPYKTTPTVNFASADVQFMDLTGDGRTDVIINSDRSFICYFQNSPLVGKSGETGENTVEPGWSEMKRITKGDLDDFPNVNFSDPRIRTADLSGDGLQDIVMLSNGGVFYWPNLGYGRFGKKCRMKNAPRPGFNFDPNRVILADINGDGLADYIYINYNSVDYWINQSGEAWGEQLEIKGTPRFSSRDSITVTDLIGTGTPGILWTYNAGESRDRMYFVDLTKGQKPYLLNEVDNNLGALTKVHYTPSTEFYLRDLYGESPESFQYIKPVGAWKTALPFPVLTVSKVEAIDRISQNKLVTRYFYHHGYWDGVEREFRGFGRVDQFDTETFEAYNTESLVLDENFNSVSPDSYSPPVYTKNWFHLGPVQQDDGDWGEVGFENEYWEGDSPMLTKPAGFYTLLKGLSRRARRDAYRTLRGTALRSELFAKDGSPLRHRPYSVKEIQQSLKLIDSPALNDIIAARRTLRHSNHIFFPFQYAFRETMWERGLEPKTSFSFTGEVDDYGQVLSTLSIAVPRGKNPLTGNGLADAVAYDGSERYQVVWGNTAFIYKDGPGAYFVDRVQHSRSDELLVSTAENVFTIRDYAFALAPFAKADNTTKRVLSQEFNYYDGAAFTGLALGEAGSFGLLVRKETLVGWVIHISDGYGSSPVPPPFTGGTADWSGYPTEFVNDLPDTKLGYDFYESIPGDPHEWGFYSTAHKLRYDVQDSSGKGLVTAMRDVYNRETAIIYDDYALLPKMVTDPIGLTVSSENDYRMLAPIAMTDPNKNVSKVAYNALGLVEKTAICGKDTGAEGDTLVTPGAIYTYDFFAFLNDGDPISVLKTVREHHINADYLSSIPVAERNNTIQSAEYSDGYGRIVQSRAQAEDIIYGDQTFGDSGLPADQSQNGPVVGVARNGAAPLNVIVSGHKRYNNKGEIVEQFEPYFDSGFDYAEDDAPAGVSLKMYYDALGRMVKTVNPDGSEQRVVFGIPNALNTPGLFTSTPWERYMYDANDLAGETHSGISAPLNGHVPISHHYTPKSEKLDTLGRVKETTEHKAHFDGTIYHDVVMKYVYDIKGQLLKSIDPYGRTISDNKYDTAGHILRSVHIDRGEQNMTIDAMGLPVISNDAKGARTLTSYDALNRPVKMYARDKTGEATALRMENNYGDSTGLSSPENQNLKGALYEQYDGAGRIRFAAYDFKGNPLKKNRRVLNDVLLTAKSKMVVDWNSLNSSNFASTGYDTDMAYDGLNRVRSITYPTDKANQRKTAVPKYNRGGALKSMKFNNTDYIKEIAYNAKGQRVLMASGSLMQRYAYDLQTFRLVRTEARKYTKSGNTYTPAAGIRLDRGYVYDLMGSVVGEKDRTPASAASQGPGSIDRVFGHDPLRRLLSATGRESTVALVQPSWDLNVRPQDYTATNTYTRSYSYDKLGNIQTLRHVANGIPANNFTRRYNYPNGFGSNMLEAMGIGTSIYPYTYDANGNQTKENTDRYFEWNHSDKLSFYKRQAGTSSPTVWSHYFYDASGQRIKKVVNKPGGIQEMTVYVDGVFEHSYVRINDNVDNNRNYNTLHVLDASSRIATLRIGKDSQDSTPALKYYVEDHLGNSSVAVQSNGNRINLEEYYPFGETSYGSFAKKRYRYNGKEKDEHTGLYEYGQRYYASWLCRFISVDPLAADYTYLTPYNYAGNKPITHKDIDGLQGTGDPPVENNVARQDNTRVATNVPNADNLKPVEPAEANVYQINKETGAAVKIDVSGLDLSKSDQAKLDKGGEFIYRNNRLSITSKETVNALNNPSEAGPLTEFALGKLKEDFKTYEGNFPENYYEDFSKAVFEKSIELNGADAGVNAASDFLDIRVMSEGSAILHSYETYARSNENTGFDKVSHFAVSARLQVNNGGLVTDFQQYSKEIFFDEIPSWFGNDIGFDSRDMLANNRGQAFGKALKEKYHPQPAEPRFRRFGE